ncbi:bifunctional 23S rRNA (guanine(2069)-N(7))-methyltransferase RlmK/23S rRNA (guanine(2445)-N(2))-methyltransferase RlmL [Trichloromonas sp.]|uniref:bifunctional 23S rRNA (guanine(2069)-N(7))-methyltransferase RlmK/23S rRNA (guanine(2445)-N(2))-methyltransferase RlmL n=1 Tax=Trichloromonas sp. TaxID=3069249 RepID=UPI002A4BC017|nr:bifunctional 23S rRNA (guanine(2069)-N(7))-methyltransferase RlmK/23S rRNA (guanine(2445)-N(2))-methyltransferase RlmL [Trichloromonas sp.]
MTSHLNFFATAPKGIEPLLADELRALGAFEVVEARAGVAFSGPLEIAYRACLWSRLASRVLLPLATFPAKSPEELYAGVRSLDWGEHLSAESTLAVDASVSGSKITHSHYAALKIKDAVVDQFRDRTGMRPSVDAERPDVRINLYLLRDTATLSLDFSGDSLHRRGYRDEGVLAPLKENLAAAILIRAGWPEIAARGGALVDPMCGSGTLLLEGAYLAGDIAPGLLRPHYGFLRWRGHDALLWQQLLDEAQGRRAAGMARIPTIVGYDADHKAIRAAWANIEKAGLRERIHVERREVAALVAPAGAAAGLLVVNPPYGERLGEVEALKEVYGTLGDKLKEQFVGWKAAIFTGNVELGKKLGLRARKLHTLYNGALECKLLHIDVQPESFVDRHRPPAPVVLSEGATSFANRLRKNLKTLSKWARQEVISCYRLYDGDIPEYAVAVDLYDGWVHVQEYQAPKEIDECKAAQRLQEVMAVLPEVLQTAPERIFLKVRKQQKGTEQYGKFGERGQFIEVREGAARLLVNLSDYLDTGLFLDHRPTRLLLGELAAGKRFLNLFAYSGAASVHAALGGAASTLTVDMSQTYLDWAKKNLALNGFSGGNHRLERADCLEWLGRAKGEFDLIFLDPPTFSNSKRMVGTFDVQRDHVELLRKTADLLAKDGTLIFSNNNRKFKMDTAALPELLIEDITRKTIPRDFERNPRIHNCWQVRKR